ncbi:BREX-1 system adenine-specific DNA-methyltransferase PglX [Acinetobacter sp. YH12117]|uniref:BREX-1 system adenine-specific DNA-methyltransferase PglX n=1 Tax=Acinetobacter sp. YH12117 TaxID=2601104 RepID=UPI0015D32A4B|nr:BREX-1 system adenine-specific DNA-methyltransferase PglX [Acinetobacter sp. YH12117]
MNTANIKKYAPQAREDFIAAITQQATKYGIYADRIEDVQRNGDVALIDDGVFPASIIKPREQLIQRIEAHGFEQTIDYIAYSWFNRLCAIRYLEVHDFLAHGRRVLSSADGSAGLPQILEDCLDIDLPGLSQERIAELKLAGNKDEELYRELLLAQCRRLHDAMPLLFEPLANDTELLLPDNLTKTDSLIRSLVSSVPEEDWANIEIIGWLYQFYISAKKDQVIGKVVKTEDIPAATQLFTPNWIVKYLVQNSVGRLWMMANPVSSTKAEWEYYIQPAEQTEDVQKQLNALIQTRIDEDGIQLNPESITVLDPACGSGHILVEAYDCLKAMYLERGYRSRDIPRLILEKNLFGLDIDNRAAQLASFALLMKAREDDRTLLRNPPKLNILALQNSQPNRVEQLAQDLSQFDIRLEEVQHLTDTFEHAKTFGSLIQVDEALPSKWLFIESKLKKALESGDIFAEQAANELMPLVTQAQLLAKQYDAVIANPPYMGGKGMNGDLKEFAKDHFPDSKSDLFAMFIERGFGWCKDTGFNSMVTMQSWMFLSSYEAMREKLLTNRTLSNMVHMGNGVMGIAFGTAATVFFNHHLNSYEGSFSYCENDDLNEEGIPKTFPVANNRLKNAKLDDFKKIPGSPIAYWVSDNVRTSFKQKNVKDYLIPKQGLATGNNEKFLRFWWEISKNKTLYDVSSLDNAKETSATWFPYSKGGESKKWYGSNEYVVYFPNGGDEIRNYKDAQGRELSRFRAATYYFKEAITWSLTSSSANGFASRYRPVGYVFDINGMSAFGDSIKQVLSLFNSKVGTYLLNLINPTMAYQIGDIGKLPIQDKILEKSILERSELAIVSSKKNWDSYDISWDFTQNPIIRTQQPTLEQAFNTWQQQNSHAVAEMKRLEEENNKLFIEAYGLQDELTPDVPDEQITLTRADREKDTQRLVSYAIGCMMGRYSLDEPGLIYAHAGNEGFDPNRYKKFKADADGIIPLTEMGWFDKDEADYRIKEFLSAVWGKDTEAENLLWLAEGLAKKNNETPEEAVRRYLATKFYKDHLQTYKKRPIYWMFSSGKLGAFQALVYLHRYNESTLARMRTEYVMPLISKMAAYAKTLEDSKEASSSAAETNRIEKQLLALHKQQAELSTFEENLRHLADQRITLDLDDGVKVNYGKFECKTDNNKTAYLLADVKAVTGEK